MFSFSKWPVAFVKCLIYCNSADKEIRDVIVAVCSLLLVFTGDIYSPKGWQIIAAAHCFAVRGCELRFKRWFNGVKHWINRTKLVVTMVVELINCLDKKPQPFFSVLRNYQKGVIYLPAHSVPKEVCFLNKKN